MFASLFVCQPVNPRHAVYDDESDYYTSAAWLSDLEREELAARDAARHTAMHDRSARPVQVTFDLAGRRLVAATPEGSLDAARSRYAQAQAPAQQAAAQQAAAARARRVAGVDALKASLHDGLCAAPDDGGLGGSLGGAGLGGSGGSSGGGSAWVAVQGDFANATLTGRSLEVAAALGSLFANRAHAATPDAAADGSGKGEGKGGGKGGDGKGAGRGGSSSKARAAAATAAGQMAGLEAVLAPWRPEQRRRKGVEIGGGLI
jgi:hypothetical protein